MTKTASLAVFLGLSALSVACGSSDEAEDGGSGASGGGASETQSGRDPTATPDDVQAPPADAEITASGLASRVLQAGTGTLHPAPADTVRVQYSGWTTDGMLFDSSYNRGRPAQFAVNAVIRGWTEGLQLMVEGEQRRFWIPSELAYGDNPSGDRPAGALTFDVELLEIIGP
jgi:FKBP-type peptidyl-prolyl cis-trans isomerase